MITKEDKHILYESLKLNLALKKHCDSLTRSSFEDILENPSDFLKEFVEDYYQESLKNYAFIDLLKKYRNQYVRDLSVIRLNIDFSSVDFEKIVNEKLDEKLEEFVLENVTKYEVKRLVAC